MQDHNKKHNDILNLIKNQGHQQPTQPQPSASSTSNMPPPPPSYNSITNPQPIAQYQPLMIYPPKAKIELSKYNGGDNQYVAWFNKTEEYFYIYNITTDEEKVKYASMCLEGDAYNWYVVEGGTQLYDWNSFKNDFFKRFQGITENEFFLKTHQATTKR
jgi:hypothetical protein